MDDSTDSFRNNNTKKNILTLSHVKTPSDLWDKELQGQQVGKEGLILFLNTDKIPCFSSIFIFWSIWKKQSAGTTLDHFMVEDEPSPPLLTCAKMWSPPAPVHAPLPSSPSPACTGFPQLHGTLGYAWLLGFGDKNTVMGTSQGSNMSQCFSEPGEKRK